MNDLKLLKHELSVVVDVAKAFSVSHTEVAKEVGISYDYARQIRKGEKPKQDTSENKQLVQNLITAYRKQIREKQEKLNSIAV